MNRLTLAVATLAVTSLAAFPNLEAQPNKFLWVGGAFVVPTGDSADGLKTGYWADVGLGMNVNPQLSLQLGGLFGSNDAKVGSGSLDALGGSLGIGYTLSRTMVLQPYVLGSVGMLRLDNGITDASSEFMLQGGGGLFAPLGEYVGAFVEGRYLQAGSDDSKFTAFPVAVGLTIAFGRTR